MDKRLSKLTPKFLARFFKTSVIDAAHLLLYRTQQIHEATTFLGYPIDQLPSDMWIYQEVVFRERPHFILQTGVDKGGSILYFATLLDLIGAQPDSIVIGVDILLSEKAKSLAHPRIRLIEGSSTDPAVITKIEGLISDAHGLIVLDSDHSMGHVKRELEIYSKFTKINDHLVVEDTNINGHPVFSTFGPGPMEAVNEFITRNFNFERDDQLWRRYLLSFHQFGWLRRIK